MSEHVRRYEIGGLIARGGMAEIVAACAMGEPGVSKRVALKRIRTDRADDPSYMARFFDEARLAMQLSHANIVQVFDFGRTEEGDFFLAMEFVEGVDLQRLRRKRGCERLPPAEALHLVAQLLRGLDYAHRRTDPAGQPLGIVHLDVKPANVLLSFEGEVKLTDFGVARSREACGAAQGICGTVAFMSPEQARGERVDPRSDVFSAGVLLYTLLTGANPFGEEDSARTLEKVRQGRTPPAARALGSELFDPLLARALAPSPHDRFPTAGAFADAIEEMLFAQGWRAGSVPLRDRVRAAFPEERARLNGLFEPGTRSEGLAVARGVDETGGTFLSRIVAEGEPPRRQTLLVVETGRGRRGALWLAAAGALGLLVLGGGALWLGLSRGAGAGTADAAVAAGQPDAARASPPPAGAAGSLPDAGQSGGSPPDAASREPAVQPRGERPPPAMGTLTVNASPWGTVFVNGKLAGTTPLLRYPVRAGQATVAIENPKLGRRVYPVKIHPRRDTPLIVDLRPPVRPSRVGPMAASHDLPTVTLAAGAGSPRLAFPKIRLKVLKGPDKGAVVTLERDEILIGSADGAHLRLTDPTVSRNHCVVRLTARGALLRDLGSTNGTRIEGVQVREGYVGPGATLELGNTRVRFEPLHESVEIPLAESERFGRLWGRSAPMRRLFALAAQVAASDVTVLIEGETGTGKDALSEAIHQASRRADGPLVVVDCGAVPPTLFESEAFGHEKGSFTGADRSRAGAFEEADGGTLFLDEIGELPLPLQPKLLRVLEAREVRRIGAAQPRKVNVRVVAATNRDLREEVNRGTFRQDLYFRLEVMRLRVPPLRERPEDIPVLVEHFRRLARPDGEAPAISAEALQSFVAHPWPGNVRELRNAVERLVVLQELPSAGAGGTGARQTAAAAAEESAGARAPPIDIQVPFKDAKSALIEGFERRYLKAMLEATGGNISEAARRAGIDRVYLLKLLGRYGLRPGRER